MDNGMQKVPMTLWAVEKRQRRRVDEPYLDLQEDLDFGRGVATPPPDLRFRYLLKSAI